MKVFQHLAQGVIAERPIFCNNSSRNEVNIDDAACGNFGAMPFAG